MKRLTVQMLLKFLALIPKIQIQHQRSLLFYQQIVFPDHNGTYNSTLIVNAIASLAAQGNAMRNALVSLGLIKGSA